MNDISHRNRLWFQNRKEIFHVLLYSQPRLNESRNTHNQRYDSDSDLRIISASYQNYRCGFEEKILEADKVGISNFLVSADVVTGQQTMFARRGGLQNAGEH